MIAPAARLYMDSSRRDVVIIGAGPAGSMAALTAARAGLDVLLIDKRHFPRPKVCGCCLNAAALRLLEPTGVLDVLAKLQPPPLDRLELRSRSRRVTLPLPRGMAVSREALDMALVEVAVVAGAAFLPGCRGAVGVANGDHRLVELDRDAQRTRIATSLVIAADGLAGHAAPAIADPASRIGLSAMIDDPPPCFAPGAIHMAWSPFGYIGAVRLETGQLDLAAAFDPAFIRSSGGAAAAMGNTIEACGWRAPVALSDPSLRITGTPLLTRRPADVAGPRLMLVGDAAGYVEPFTGEGIAWALASGRAAAAIAADALAAARPNDAEHRWRTAHRALLSRRQHECLRLTRLLRRPALVGAALALLQRFPVAAAPLVRRVNAPFALDPLAPTR